MLTGSCLSPLSWFACPDCREALHTWADLAVVVAVIIGVITLLWQRRERRERQEAVDALIRALASRATHVWRAMLGNRPRGDPEGVRYLAQYVAGINNAMGEALAATFTGIAAQAPYASPSTRGPAREVSDLFWSIVARTDDYRLRQTAIGADLQAALERDHGAVLTLLTQIAG